MKKLVKISILFFIGTILMTSCNSNFSITKRHYSSGYYVDNGKSKHPSSATNEHDQLEKDITANNTIVEREHGTIIPVVDNSVSANVDEDNGKIQSEAISDPDQKQGSNENPQFTKDPRSEIKSTFLKFKKTGSLHGEGDGLSLFWIIILIILILWLFGVISTGFAIGSIINLLLLVALILLILWLLRII